VLLLVGAYFFLFYPGTQVSEVVILGNKRITADMLQSWALENSETGLINFGFLNISTKSIFLVDPEELGQKTLKKFPLIKKIKINKKYPNTLMLDVVERSPVGVFCSESDKNCFLVDENGVIYEPVGAPANNLTIIRQSSENLKVYAGEQVISLKIADAISRIRQNLKDKFNIDLTQAIISTPIRMDMTTNEGWQIFFNLKNDADTDSQLVKLDLLLAGEISDEQRNSLEYIDLRFKDRAFYK
jgi:cell division septal protein FtsQ